MTKRKQGQAKGIFFCQFLQFLTGGNKMKKKEKQSGKKKAVPGNRTGLADRA
jgi:hypothetical protein